MTKKQQHFVIVGGGTAGWLSALMLQRVASQTGLPLRITVVESSKIPTIGVGEGTTAVFRQLLGQLGLDEREFIKATGATIKLGIRHKNWRRKGHNYDGPIDDPHLVSANPAFSSQEQASALDIYCVANERSVTDTHLFGHLMRQNKSPFALAQDGKLIPAGPFDYAFHFDQAKVGAYLRGKAQDHSNGIAHLDAQVSGVLRDGSSGNITALSLDDGSTFEGDFFIDCTGFRRELIAKGMGAKWVSFAADLPVNRAMPFWLEHKPGSDIAPYTLASAQDAGWMWSIPTQDRIGCGYVYSDAFCTPDQAQQEIETALGLKIEPRNDLKFDSGRLDAVWIGNCLALGLSSSFLEPLEATSIHGTIVQMMLFTQYFLPSALNVSTKDRDSYNGVVARQLDDFRDFINLHYVSERTEPFWVHVQNQCLSKNTRDRLAYWSGHMPLRGNFELFPGNLPHIEEQLYYPVLDGLGLLDAGVAKAHLASTPKVRAHARKTTQALKTEYRSAAHQCIAHRDYLNGLNGVS